MHHAVLERWSRGGSLVHRREARAKLLLLVAFLAALATLPSITPASALGFAAFLVAGVLLSRLPIGGILLRAGVVLPFSATFGLFSVIAGDLPRALSLVFRSYCSAVAVLILAGSTPLPQLLRGLESLGAPKLFVLVVQFLYRYLFVISEQAQHMRLAAACRGRWSFRAAAGAVAVLFARSYARAQGIHQAMLARGFTGRMPLLAPPGASWRDALFVVCGVSLLLVLRLALGGIL